MSQFTDIYYQKEPKPVFCYRTGKAVYEEGFENGRLVSYGYNTAGYPLNVLSNCPTRLDVNRFCESQVFCLNINGQSYDNGFSFVGFQRFYENNGNLHGVITLAHLSGTLTVEVHTVLDSTPVFCRYLVIKNNTDNSLFVSRFGILNGGIECMDKGTYPRADLSSPYRVGYFEGTEWGKEGDFIWHELPNDTLSFGGKYSRDRYRQPFFVLQNRVKGYSLIGQLAFSGGYRFSFDVNSYPTQNEYFLSFHASLDSYAPLLVLKPKEEFTSPEMHLGILQGDLDDAVNAFHAHTRKSILNDPLIENACLVGSGMGAEHDMNVDTTKQFMEQMAKAGAEVFIVDAGWYCPPAREQEWHPFAGDWVADQNRYPKGIQEIRDTCKALGMKFGLWMEPERMGYLSDAYRQHPDFFTQNRFGEEQGGYLDFSNPEVIEWALQKASHVIEDYQIDLLRIDYNVGSGLLFHKAKNESGECLALRHVMGVYEFYRRLKQRYPHVIFENCAGGGGRTDLGMMKSFHHTWVTDMQVPPKSLFITNGMTMCLPPDRVDRLVAGMGCHQNGSLAFHMRNAMLGHISLNVFAPKDAFMNEEVFAFIRHSVDLYKSFIRPYLEQADIFHHTPDNLQAQKEGLMILELSAPDKTKSTLALFTLPGFVSRNITVIPKGISVGKRYRVTYDNSGDTFTAEGRQLITHGLTVTLPAALMSELVLLEEI